MRTVVIEIPFCAGHRLLGHKGRCRHLHGHNYTARVTVARKDGWVDGMGMVIDFADLKAPVKAWIDEHWDHNVILHGEDPICSLDRVLFLHVLGDRKPFTMPYNPTAENMARGLFIETKLLLSHHDVNVVRVEIQETPNCSASFSEANSCSH